MRILIYTLARTGSTSLTYYIANSLKYEGIFEPYNIDPTHDKYPESLIWESDNVVVKVMDEQGGKHFLDFYGKFDKYVILTRENTQEQAQSLVHAVQSKKWHSHYVYNSSKVDQNYCNQMIEQYTRTRSKLLNLNGYQVTYEGIYLRRDQLKGLNEYLGITNPSLEDVDIKRKYRQGDANKSLI